MICKLCNEIKTRQILHMGEQQYHTMPCPCVAEPACIPYRIQEDPHGCMVACIAMVMDEEYQIIREQIHEERVVEGVDHSIADEVLTENGWAVARKYEGYHPPLVKFDSTTKRPKWPVDPWTDRHICVVTNLSKTGTHAVVLLGDGRVFDPWWGVIESISKYSRIYNIAAVTKL